MINRITVLTAIGLTLLAGIAFSAARINPTIRHIEDVQRDFINSQAGSYYNPKWKMSLSQYKSWLAMIPLMESGNMGSAAHSGGAVGRETFYHVSCGKEFPFSTSAGSCQLRNGGYWDKMPLIDRIDPKKAILSVMRWHADFPNGSTLLDFQRRSRWYAVKPSLEFEKYWRLITEKTWEECRSEKVEVTFRPPVMPAVKVATYIGIKEWKITDWKGSLHTWKIDAKTFRDGKNLYSFSYYYSFSPETSIEVLAWEKDTRHGYLRKYDKTCFPAWVSEDTAGFTNDEPMLEIGPAESRAFFIIHNPAGSASNQ